MVFGKSSLHILRTGQFNLGHGSGAGNLSLWDGLGGGVISSLKFLDHRLGSPACVRSSISYGYILGVHFVFLH